MDDWELEETRRTRDGGNTGTVLAERYRIVRQLGHGGMGSVWLAEDEKLDNRRVALKMLPSVLIANQRAYAQLKSEALVSLKLVHSNIVALRAFEENGGNPFLVMDYVQGRTLDDYLAEKGTLSEGETVRILKPVADALDYAHGKGVAHRDVKPANVMLGEDGTPYVLDFGIAREIQETMTRVTGKSSSGTLLYMSPEQLKGGSPAAPQDVYSFAAMAYECLKGEPPFSRGQVEYQILNETPQPLPPGIGIAASVMAGLSKTPEGRPATCAAVLGGTRPTSRPADSQGWNGKSPATGTAKEGAHSAAEAPKSLTSCPMVVEREERKRLAELERKQEEARREAQRLDEARRRAEDQVKREREMAEQARERREAEERKERERREAEHKRQLEEQARIHKEIEKAAAMKADAERAKREAAEARAAAELAKKDAELKVQQAKMEAQLAAEVAQRNAEQKVSKKRWIFVVLGLLLGWLGVHLLYAKRRGLFVILVASFIGFCWGVGNNHSVANTCFLSFVGLWLGGAFFIKKDGKGKLMK